MFRLRKLTYVAVLVCVLLLNINVLATQQRDEAVNEAAELNDQAVACVKDHEYPRAVDLLKRTIALQPNLFMTQAIASYKRALTLNPEYAEAHHNLAVLYLQRGQRSLALEQYHLLQSIDYELSEAARDHLSRQDSQCERPGPGITRPSTRYRRQKRTRGTAKGRGTRGGRPWK